MTDVFGGLMEIHYDWIIIICFWILVAAEELELLVTYRKVSSIKRETLALGW